PVIGLIDTDADPEMLDCPIPGNDDAIKSVRYITSFIVDVIKETVGNIKKEKETVVPLQENEEKKDEETQADNLNVDSVKEDGPDA
ncbi:MAG: 30S ribosomal protein S2, partial [Candidatus Omnitrophota bacterium]